MTMRRRLQHLQFLVAKRTRHQHYHSQNSRQPS
jgi:hypothetical protein